MNHSHDYFEINSSVACTSFISTPAISPPNYSFGSLEDSVEERELTGTERKLTLPIDNKTIGLWAFAGIAVVFSNEIHLL